MPRKPKTRRRRSAPDVPPGLPTPPATVVSGRRTPRSQANQTFFQCLACGGLLESMYGSGEESWCRHCHAAGQICTLEGRIPDPQLYGSWVTKREQAAERQRTEQEVERSLNSLLKTEGDLTMKRKKTHTGAFHCPACFIEFDLVAEESLKCDQCGGPLAEGTLEQIWAEEDNELSPDEE